MSAQRPNVLIVEDNILTAELLAERLNAEGFATQVALSGDEALRRLENFPPDVVYVGTDVADMDRWSLCLRAEIRRGPARPPMIVAAGGSDIGFAKSLMVDTWRLPFDIEDLCGRIRRLCWTGRTLQATA